jgi:hypothetical protein
MTTLEGNVQTTEKAGGRRAAASFIDSGLDFASEAFGDEERQSLLAWYEANHDHDGLDLASFARFQLHHDPGGFKRGRRYVFTLDEPGEDGNAVPLAVALLCYVHSYTVLGYGEGVFYEAIALRNLGATKAEVLATIRLGAYTSGPRGLNLLGRLMVPYLDEWPDDEGAGIEWPAHWTEPATVLRSGVDLATDELTEGERAQIVAWYERVYGEVPPHFAAIASSFPGAAKTNQVRFDSALAPVLRARCIPLLLLHTAAMQSRPASMRRAVLMARTVGLDRREVVSTLLWAAVHGGDEVLGPAFDACGDVIEALSTGS